ncbi:MAG: hypothetical protein AAFV54_14275, partial [Pseudomonadota bacterium]
QHRQAAQFTGLSSACTGKHRSDGPKADNALTIKPDHPMGARHLTATFITAAFWNASPFVERA